MKKAIIVLFSLILASTLSAQSLKEVQKNVREGYADAMKMITMQAEEPNIATQLKITTRRTESGVGKCEYTTEFYGIAGEGCEEKTGDGKDAYALFFVRDKKHYLDASIGDIYWEYLYNSKGKVIFSFEKISSFYAEEEVYIETRYYYDDEGKYAGGSLQIKSKENGRVLPVDEIEFDENGAVDSYEAGINKYQAFDILMNKRE